MGSQGCFSKKRSVAAVKRPLLLQKLNEAGDLPMRSTIILQGMTDRGGGWDVRALLGVLEAVVLRRCQDLQARATVSLQSPWLLS